MEAAAEAPAAAVAPMDVVEPEKKEEEAPKDLEPPKDQEPKEEPVKEPAKKEPPRRRFGGALGGPAWDDEQDTELARLVEEKGDDWAKIAATFSVPRSAGALRQRWSKIGGTPPKKEKSGQEKTWPLGARWDDEQDDELARLVEEMGTKAWDEMAEAFEEKTSVTRSGHALRNRWFSALAHQSDEWVREPKKPRTDGTVETVAGPPAAAVGRRTKPLSKTFKERLRSEHGWVLTEEEDPWVGKRIRDHFGRYTTMEPDETPRRIATNLGIDVEELVKVNRRRWMAGLTATDEIDPGTRLFLPKSSKQKDTPYTDGRIVAGRHELWHIQFDDGDEVDLGYDEVRNDRTPPAQCLSR